MLVESKNQSYHVLLTLLVSCFLSYAVADEPFQATHLLKKDIVYDTAQNDPLQKLDLYLPLNPAAKPEPLLIYVHGGAWQSGDKASDTSQSLINLLSPRFPHQAIASINYRLSLDNKVKHPDHNKDVAVAVDFLLDHPHPEYDSGRIILTGHSVGAFICVSVSGLLSGHPDTTIKNPKAVIGLGLLDGIYDLRELVKEYPRYTFVKNAIGADGDPYNWDSVSPTHWPLAQTSSAWPRILVIHSKDDTLLTTRQSQLMIDHFNQLVRDSNPAPKPSIEVDFDSVRGDHDELLGSAALADRLLKWIKPSTT